MKRLFTYAAILALLLPASCTNLDEERGGELTFRASGAGYVKGYVDGSSLRTSAGWRTITLTSFLHAQSGRDEAYFVGESFVCDNNATTPRWHHAGAKLYWPLGARLDYIGYSSDVPFVEEDVIYSSNNVAERMRLNVGRDHTQDDVMFGAAWGRSSASGTLGLRMYHSQAWIDVRLVLASGAAALPVTVTGVYLREAYDKGRLTIENNFGEPEYSWDFRAAEARDRLVQEGSSVYGTTITSTAKTLSMLIPEQERTSLIVKYTVSGVECTAEKNVSGGRWVAGKRYVYEFRFNPVSHSAVASSEEELLWGDCPFEK